MEDEAEVVDKAHARVLLGSTPNGKDIYLMYKQGKSLREIAFGSGGKLPKQLGGSFSSVQAAQHAVASYLAKVAAKEIKSDGTKAATKS